VNIVGLGSEIVECLRIARMIERHADLFINRVYTAEEIRFCQSRKQTTQHLAAHWAGKEAVLKALGIHGRRGLRWLDVELRHESNGQISVGIRGAVQDAALALRAGEIQVTVAHCRSHATAYALVMADERTVLDDDEPF
jgi:holo-[acyl-carrier protein] synthase